MTDKTKFPSTGQTAVLCLYLDDEVPIIDLLRALAAGGLCVSNKSGKLLINKMPVGNPVPKLDNLVFGPWIPPPEK
jgi:hypothetical protein